VSVLLDKVALITGGNSGIGLETALLFAKEGARVGLAARRAGEGREAVERIRAAGGEAVFIETDVTRREDCCRAVAVTAEAFGRLDIAFNNAGAFSFGKSVADLDEDEWDRVVDVNLKGTFLSMKAEIPEILKAGGGAIINMSSVAGLVGSALGLSAYHASKHGVVGLTKAAALELAPRKVRVNAICPGVVPTDMTEKWFEGSGLKDTLQANHPVGRFGTLEETAEAVLYLASDRSAFTTGIALPVDGGFSVG
jgi:NAD(P)-dependent dehydrogenase (short-subunit alcohol dehydrogenase family)